MYRVCISGFNITPWNNRLKKMIITSLEKDREKYLFESTHGYPTKNYDIIFLCGIRSITKSKLDILKLRKYCKYIVEFGDIIDDPRDAGADLYFFFNPTKKKIDGKKYLPKLINESELYPEHSDKLTIYVDHYKHQNDKESEMSRLAIKFVFNQINKFKKLNLPFDLYFHSENGVEKNPTKINLPVSGSQNCKILDYYEIVKYYRKTHIFFPTHRETQGMLAQEIGLCGGITVLQPWMYPQETHYQFRNLTYNFNEPLNIIRLKEMIEDKNFIKDNRNQVLKYCSEEIFSKTFLEEIDKLIKSND